MRFARRSRTALALAASFGAAIAAAPARAQTIGSDYPTAERADYVFGCMAANGQTRESLEKCSCSIDTIATLLPYNEYEEAETVLRMNKIAGQSSELFRSSGDLKDKVSNLRRAQAEAEIKCFY
ncbi:hypothetical protein IHQ68_07690 [Chelatococcus sambhunathii]|uniref:Uncharacterized protein n=1 Tax=Chelatococcus sambhunathii TaxID=363953 RepID=A0ABU1DEF5_9HYPH|nr:hypothetical protein [Chelatococcus sambhunathii]MDR4306496.1 hypothetical protein [Chelatococcus sambhunathii]